MYLEITPTGGKYWRMKYRFGGKEKHIAFGVYPDVSLAQARARCGQARKQLANGVDPGVLKQASKAGDREQLRGSRPGMTHQVFTGLGHPPRR